MTNSQWRIQDFQDGSANLTQRLWNQTVIMAICPEKVQIIGPGGATLAPPGSANEHNSWCYFMDPLHDVVV